MANGDITAVKVLYRQSLGGGQTIGGVKKSTKTLVIGEITCTYLLAGIAVNKLGGDNCFGVLGDVDFVKLFPITINAIYPTAQKLHKADYDFVNKKIFCLEDVGQNTHTIPTDGDVVVIRFVAIGDDADAPELT